MSQPRTRTRSSLALLLLAGEPSMLLFLVDQQRTDGVAAYGEAEVSTPHLDALAESGVRFTRAYTAQPVCAPNRASLFSGLYPHRHGVRENGFDLDTDVRLLPDVLRASGYRTAYFGKWHLGDEARDAWDVMPRYKDDGRGDDHYFGSWWNREYQTEAIAQDASEFLEGVGATPFLLVVSLYPPHPPYSVPGEYEDAYESIYPDDEKRRVYYAMCTAVDDAIGSVLGALDRSGQRDRTLVVHTSDHGHFFERRWNDHEKRLCYDESARVPLLMRLEGTLPAGGVVTMPFNHVDFLPTVLGLLGRAPEPWSARSPLDLQGIDGRDFSAAMLGVGDAPTCTVLVNVPFIDDRGERNRPALEAGQEVCVVSATHKLIFSNVRPPELYDLEADPAERVNLWSRDPHAERDRLIAHLAAWSEAAEHGLAARFAQRAQRYLSAH